MFDTFIKMMTDYILFPSCLFILAASIYISFKTRFVQLRFFPLLLKMLRDSLKRKTHEEGAHTILPHKALLTAMSTTLGISTIVAPTFAIYMGGPGALLGFLLTSLFGSAATYAEVSLSIQHRKKTETGEIMGGPMQYIKYIMSSGVAKWYALCCLTLMTAWSGAQANQVAAILDSPLLGDYRIPIFVSGAFVAVLVFMTLMGGIKRIGAISAKIVPLMFALYLGSCFWIIFSNVDKLGAVFSLIFQSAFSPYAMASGTIVGGLVSALRWGVFKGLQSNEAGIGTQSIPHSMAETTDPVAQGALAMLSTYTAGLVAFLSGCVVLITNTWQDPDLPLGISMVAAAFEMYFSTFGIAIVAICVLLFGFGTILGNSYNGSQCYRYLMDNKKTMYYFLASAAMVFVGAISDMKILWSLMDIVLVGMVVPHVAALVLYTYKKPEVVLTGIEESAEVRLQETNI
jgi:AGCS family alanine or glycine:cation symporter